jgi:uncharacterized membrane protein
MAAYHVVLVHFPIALWMTATLAILVRAFSDGSLAKSIERALVPLIALGLIMGVIAYVVGLLVWPWEAASSSPMARNHMLLASWTLGYWVLILVTLWIHGEQIWQGFMRWIVAVLAVIGSGLLAITGTLGGHLVGVYSELVEVLRLLGWEVYTTFYLPNWTLGLVLLAGILLLAAGWWGRRQDVTGGES